MHEDELLVDRALVRRLLREQLPEWAELPLARVPSDGTDNALFRLGDELVVRLPRREPVGERLLKECDWLPRLAPFLPVAVPEPVALGAAGDAYPWPWAVLRWIDGRPAGHDPAPAAAIGAFVAALHRLDLEGAPPPGPHNFFRGVPLASRDEQTRTAIAAARRLVAADAVTTAWERALAAPAWDGPRVPIHGDVAPGNLLVRDGRLAAVIDWGGFGAGDPACDLIVGWNLLDAREREVFRGELDVDDATWERGRGWALSVALIQLPYYVEKNPPLAANARRVIDEVLKEASA